MEQERIGKFIQECRKEKDMSQKELADQLGITDRAVSKWENGRGMPDVSLMKPLCDVLGITINELLSGERIAKKDYQEKSEFNFLSTIEYKDKMIMKKNVLLRIVLAVAIVISLAVFLLVYLLPVTRGYFRKDEDLEIFSVVKTLPVTPYGEPLVRYSATECVEQDITERIDLEQLEALLPLMRVTVYKENYGHLWQGDFTYEIFGYFKSGPRAGETFRISLGDDQWNYLRPHAGNRSHIIVNNEAWIDIMEMLEGWEGEYRENFLWEEERTFSLIYEGKLYSGPGRLMDLPEGTEFSHIVSGISSYPDEELECSFGTQGLHAGTWTEDGQTYLAVQVSYDKAYGIPIETQ